MGSSVATAMWVAVVTALVLALLLLTLHLLGRLWQRPRLGGGQWASRRLPRLAAQRLPTQRFPVQQSPVRRFPAHRGRQSQEQHDPARQLSAGRLRAWRLWVGQVKPVVVTAVGVGVVVVGMALAAGVQVMSLQAGPVGELAESGAAVKVRLKVAGDPAVRSTPGSRRPPYVVVRAVVEEVRGRGTATRVRTPVVVIGSVQWKEVRFGQHVEATGRLGAVDKGDDVAAMLSSRVAPRVLDEPAWWLRAAERVRAGLRESVAAEPEAVRGLVPALVMGDESGMPPELAEDFKTTGLTHLSAVSGALDLGAGMASNFTRLP
ncbi:ComEC/Rec2 family competence protein [Kribbella sp. CA-294648]|uniref:ComEC/Rec2 family competence protein n=1 Tax=Kribbella sp. CA-294648 TaxID=3239948 RepID=UPI003D8EFB18